MTHPDRINRRRALALAGGIIGAGTGALSAPLDAAAGAVRPDLVFEGVTIVDTHDGSLVPNMAVAIAGGKIVAIAPSGAIPAERARVVRATGKFVVPGYNDFHSHPLSSADPQGGLALMLANGITGFREMAAWDGMLAARRQGTLVPPGAGPALLELAGEILTPINAATPAAAVAEVRRQNALGADFIKVIDYSPDVFFAVAEECRRLDIRFLGHLAPTVDVRKAVAAKMHSIEHMGPSDSILLGCSTEEATLRPIAIPPPPRPAANAPIPRDVLARATANPTVGTSPAVLTRYQRVIETFSEPKFRELAARFVAAGTWQVPTLIRIRTMQIGDDPRYRNDPNLRYVPKHVKQTWEDVSQQFASAISPEGRQTLRRLNALQTQLVKPFKDAGAHMLAGSDGGGSGGFCVAGFSLHEEFDLLSAAGLSPLTVLQMTTLNGARFLGRDASMGSVAVGKNADLVLLDANPIARVGNLHSIFGVVRAGKYYSTGDLEALKERTAERVASGAVAMRPMRPACC